jgi:hypothetical protein
MQQPAFWRLDQPLVHTSRKYLGCGAFFIGLGIVPLIIPWFNNSRMLTWADPQGSPFLPKTIEPDKEVSELERFPPKLLDFGDKEALQLICFRAFFPVLIESKGFDQNGKGSKVNVDPGRCH